MGDGYERFEVSNEDYQDALDPMSRKRRKFTKEDAVYGMWAENDSDEEGGRKGFTGGGCSKPKDFSTKVSFVSSGVQEGTAKEAGVHHNDDNESASFSKPKKATRKPDKFAGIDNTPNLAHWEKHTKGIGMKLLGMMGYEKGKGLGREGGGIVTPIESVVRKGRGAIGAYGSENIKDPRQKNEPELIPVKKKQVVQQKRQWKKTEGDIGSYQFKTVEELLEEKDDKAVGGWDTSELSKVKVIDMTGKDTKVLSGYHAMHTRRDADDEFEVDRVFDVQELRHNLDILIEMSEARIIESSKKLEYERNLASSFLEEERMAKENLDNDSGQVTRLENVLNLIDRLVTNQETITLHECADVFTDLYEKHLDDYRWFELDQLAAAVVGPVMHRFLLNWNPLTDCSFGHRELQQWKRLLEPPQKTFEQSRNIVNSFHNLLWEVWMPFVREAIANWSPTDMPERDPVIDLIAIWEPIMPQWMCDNILEQQVLPRLVQEVDEWDPTTARQSIHLWIHPWLPYLGPRLEVVYGTIQQKLSVALTRWHPSDASAKIMLSQWIDVWSRATWDQFLIKNILPKLQLAMDSLVVNPREQNLDPWNHAMEWQDLLPLNSMAALLEKHFFPKWINVLSRWLQSDPNHDEIRLWYYGWKKMIPPALVAHPSTQEQLVAALFMISRSIFGDQADIFQPLQPPPPSAVPEMPSVSLGFTNSSPTFKDVVERRANERGLVFMPVPGKMVQGRQVSKFGNHLIYIDKNVVFVQRGSGWTHISLDDLLSFSN